MFVILLRYVKPLAEVDRHLPAHREFLQRHYAAGRFLLSGRKEPRDGGVIVADVRSRAQVDEIVRDDPFHRAGIATYEIIEFVPSMAAVRVAGLGTP